MLLLINQAVLFCDQTFLALWFNYAIYSKFIKCHTYSYCKINKFI